MPICKGFKWDLQHKQRNVPCKSKATWGGYCGNHAPGREKTRTADLEQARAVKKEKHRNTGSVNHGAASPTNPPLAREVATMKIRIYDLETRIANQDQQIFVLTNKLNNITMTAERRNTL